MEIDDYIERIIEKDNIDDMYILSDMLEDLMKILERTDKDTYKNYALKLYKMAYGNHLTKELAQQIVSEMKPEQERWDYNEVAELKEQYGLNDFKTADFYAVMNMAYNDYKDLFDENVDMYIRFTIDFLKDEDAKEDKVTRYFI